MSRFVKSVAFPFELPFCGYSFTVFDTVGLVQLLSISWFNDAFFLLASARIVDISLFSNSNTRKGCLGAQP